MKPTVGAALTAVVNLSIGLGGGPAGRPPRPPRPPARPAGALGAGGTGGGAESAAINGARSSSVGQRNNSIVNGAAEAGPTTVARSFSAVLSAACPVVTA